MPLMYAVLIL